MRTIVLALTLMLGAMMPSQVQESEQVYICTGGSSKTYHKTDKCNGLRRCSKEIKQITKEQAEEMGRRPCKICY